MNEKTLHIYIHTYIYRFMVPFSGPVPSFQGTARNSQGYTLQAQAPVMKQ